MATKLQEILLKGNTTNASAVPSSLKVREIAINALDRSLFTNDGNSIVKLYTGTTKWFDVNGNANNALKLGGVLASEYIGKEAFNTHTNNTTIHITAAERTKWNNKWDYNEETIKGVKVNAAVLSDKATKLATPRTLWGKPFDGSSDVSGDLTNVGNITASGKATIQGDIISGGEVVAVAGEGTPAGVTDYSALTGKPSINGVTLVSGNNTLASLGIQAAGDYATNSGVTTLLANYADKTFVSNNYVGKSAFNSHTADTDIHITSAERAAWDAKWDYNENTIKAVKVTSASSADKLNSSEGTSTIPIYFKNGKPTQCIPSDLFSVFDNAYSSTETSLGITIAGCTRMVVVAYSQTAGSVAWTGITGKPSTFTPSAHKHATSDITGLPTALKNPFAVEIKANGVSLGTYDGSKAATFNLNANNVGAASKIHTHTASEVSGLPTKLSAFTNDVGYITGITKSMVEGVLTGNITSHTHTFASLNSKPTTLSGYGITDVYTSSTIDSKLSGYLPLSGGTMTGSIIVGSYTSFGVSGGIFYLGNPSYPVAIRSNGTTTINGNTLIHSGNYNSYAPTLTGTGASGTWGISISGNASTATTANTINIFIHSSITTPSAGWYRIAYYPTRDMVRGLTEFQIYTYGGANVPIVNTIRINGNWSLASMNHCIIDGLRTYIGNIRTTYDDTNIYLEFYCTEAISAYLRVLRNNASVGNVNETWKWYTDVLPEGGGTEVSLSDGYIDYVKTAESATKLQTPRTIWGQSFDGTANVSGDLSLERYRLYWNGDVNGSFISSDGMNDMIYNMRDGHIFEVGGDRILTIKRYYTYKLEVNGKTHIAGDLIVDGEVSALVA